MNAGCPPSRRNAGHEPLPPEPRHSDALSPTRTPSPSKNWLAENLEALESSNKFVEQHGVPLAKYRQF